ncbi:NUDIX pyrophosphatase [Candidatus Bathyarchaeota archaeon]|nr:NUDIX pyrophosphatase [Candidatus Bathyarchaeota archaeon]
MRLDVKEVVTCFLFFEGKILIVRRSDKVGSYQGLWAGFSGYIEDGDLEQAYKEVKEETHLTKDDISLVKAGIPLKVVDENINIIWIIHPFLFVVKNPEKIELDWEHIESRWIFPEQIKDVQTVPCLYEALQRVLEIKK